MNPLSLLGLAAEGAPIPTPTKVLAIACAVLLALLAVSCGAVYVEHLRVANATQRAESAEADVVDLRARVLRANAATATAARINADYARAADAQSASIEAARAHGIEVEQRALRLQAQSMKDLAGLRDRLRAFETQGAKPAAADVTAQFDEHYRMLEAP